MNPRFATVAPLLLLGQLLPAVQAASPAAATPAAFFVYFGTYTKGASQGIYRAGFDGGKGTFSPLTLAAETKDPSFLAVHPRGDVLYAVEESSTPAKTPGRGVSAFSLNRASGELTLLNQQSAGGAGPCFVTTDREGKCVLIANYGGGSVESIRLLADGRLGEVGTFIQHTGSSANPSRQKGPHAHGFAVSPDNRFALAADLGLDRVFVYRLNAAAATLEPHSPAFAYLPPGSGPRHLALHPNGRLVFVINEILCTVAAFRYDATAGTLTQVQVVSTLPPAESVKPGYSTAEIAVHPGGRFLYGSNRGHDSIVVFAINAASGQLTLVGHQPARGHMPRHFAIDPTGNWLLAESQDSNSATVFRIDATTGRLTPTGAPLEVPAPVCAVFVPVKR